MIRKFFELFLIVALFTSMTACAATGPQLLDGQVDALQVRSTVWGIQQAVAGKAGTFRLMKDGMVLLGWPLENGAGFSLIDPAKTSLKQYMDGGLGNFANSKTVTDLISYLKSCGWNEVSAKDLPQEIIQGIATASSWLASAASKMSPTFIFMPVAPLEQQMEKIQPEPQTQ